MPMSVFKVGMHIWGVHLSTHRDTTDTHTHITQAIINPIYVTEEELG